MISQLTGILAAKTPDHCTIDVGGVGYGVSVSLTTFAKLPELGHQMRLAIHTYVREDQLLLYGFATDEERILFQKLIAISGVGPKTALAILSGLPAGHLIDAISTEDRARLSTIPGVGKKTAERIIIELKDRLARDTNLLASTTLVLRGKLSKEVLSALINLGYPRTTAERALSKVHLVDEMPIEAAIKAALKELCRMQ